MKIKRLTAVSAEHEKYADLYIEWRPAPSHQWVFSATKYGKIGARIHPVTGEYDVVAR